MTTRRCACEPDTIALAAGEAVSLEITSLDFVHGFHLPALDIRADLVPGRVTRVDLPPLPSGHHVLLCENFCGSSHEDMGGTLVVGVPA